MFMFWGVGSRVSGLGFRRAQSLVFFHCKIFFVFFLWLFRGMGEVAHIHTHTHTVFHCKIFFFVFFLWLFKGMGEGVGDVFLFFVLTARFFFLFFSCGSSEEWEKLLEDIKHYPDVFLFFFHCKIFFLIFFLWRKK